MGGGGQKKISGGGFFSLKILDFFGSRGFSPQQILKFFPKRAFFPHKRTFEARQGKILGGYGPPPSTALPGIVELLYQGSEVTGDSSGVST